jgi:hypothetical protein
MPYIKQDKRDVIDPVLEPIFNALRELESDDDKNNMEGNINYLFTRILQHVYPGGSYREVNDAVGVLECCKQEYYQRIAVPYEMQKAFENGDVLPANRPYSQP